MPMRVTDPLRAAARGTPEAAIAFAQAHGAKRLTDVKRYIRGVYRLAPKVGLDPAIIVSQSSHETANWTSFWWNERLNPAGIGITGHPPEDEVSRVWERGDHAARAHVAHLLLYCTGRIEGGGLKPADDPRHDAYLSAHGARGIASTLADLAGTWAVDTGYAAKVARHGDEIFADLSPTGGTAGTGGAAAITFGRVPAPFERRIMDKPKGWRRGTRTIRGVCLHSMIGFLQGTESYFMNPNEPHGWNALTDFGIGGSKDGARDGAVWMWNDPFGNRIPFANGWDEAGPDIEGDGIAFVDRYGQGAINSDLASVERSDGGDTNTPVSAAQFEAICQTVAWVIDQARIPWSTWPKNNDGVHALYWHSEFAVKQCPFPPVKERTKAIIERVGEILKQHQEGGYAKPKRPPTFDGTDKTVDGRLYHAAERTVTISVDELNFRQQPDPASSMTRSPMRTGKTFRVLYWVEGADVGGVNAWWVTRRGHFVWCGGTAERPGA